MHPLTPAIAGLLISINPLSACAANLLANPNFATGLTAWNVSASGSASATFDGSSGSPSKGSAHLQSTDGDAAQLTQCLDVSATHHVDLTARQHVVFVTAQFAGASVALNAYGSAACAGPVLASIGASTSTPGLPGFVNGAAQAWDELSALDQALPAKTVSVAVTLYAIAGSGADADVYFDDIHLQPTATSPVTLQSFGVD